MGIHPGHDRGCAIMLDNKLAIAINEERLSRIKKDLSDRLPVKSIKYCMDYLDLKNEDIDLIAYSTTDDVDVLRPQIEEAFPELDKDQITFLPHHLAHAYSTFGGSDFQEAAVIVADAMGSILADTNPMCEWYQNDEPTAFHIGSGKNRYWAEGFAIYHFKNRFDLPTEVYKKWIQMPFFDWTLNPEDFEVEKENRGVSIGYAYGTGAVQLVYDPVSRSFPSGKLMGLASYADKEWVNKHEDRSIRKDDDLIVPFEKHYPKINWESGFQDKANVAGIYQREQELNSLHLAKIAKNLTGCDNICVAGGSFLNCNTNELIIKSDLFKNQYFVPPSDDSGIAIGLAMYASTKLGSSLDDTSWMLPYSGKVYEDTEIQEAINSAISNNPNIKLAYHEFSDIESTAKYAAKYISENKVIGWFQGGSEMGPRALGNRSIVANPQEKWMESYINSEVKKREWYRPFAPSVLKEKVSEIFELDEFSPYMLVTTTVKPEWRSKIPAVTHIDNTSRYQSVDKEWNYPYYTLIEEFYKITGVPVVLNTSFNGPSEPIVESPQDAVNTMIREGLDAIFMGNKMLYRTI